MTTPFSESYRARWVDMDFNQHMRNAAFLGVAEETRMRYLDANGFPVAELQRLQIGPVVLEDKLTYRKELRLLEAFRVDLQLAGASPDLRKMKLRNTFYAEEGGVLCAIVDSMGLWFDIAARKPIVPPGALRDAMFRLPKTSDFTAL